jgi:hypothetical protein
MENRKEVLYVLHSSTALFYAACFFFFFFKSRLNFASIRAPSLEILGTG